MSLTTSYRLSQEVGSRLKFILTRANNLSPVPKIMEKILLEAAGQIDSPDQPTPLPSVVTLRNQILAASNIFPATSSEANQHILELSATVARLQEELAEYRTKNPKPRAARSA